MVHLDDVLVTGPTDYEHLQTLDRVLERLVLAGFCMKESKCQFMSNEVEYLGHRIDARGIHAAGDALTAVSDTPAPGKRTWIEIVSRNDQRLRQIPT